MRRVHVGSAAAAGLCASPILAQDRDPADSQSGYRYGEAMVARRKVDTELVDVANAVAQKLIAR